MDPAHERPGRSTLLARGLWILAIVLCLLGVGLAVGYGPSTRNSIGPRVVFVPLVLVFGGAGALIATRRREHAIGWIFLAAALCWSVEVLGFGYATRAAGVGETGSQIAIFADWLQTWLWIPGIGLAIGPLFLFFPELRFEVTDDGRGFDPATTSYGTGVQGMADRLAAVGGELTIRSAPGAGTTVCGRLAAEAIT